MKKLFLLAAILMGAAGSANAQFGGFNTKKAIEAVSNTAKAVTISDADIEATCKEYIAWMDEHNKVDKTAKYNGRLQRLVKGINSVDGKPLNFKVYYVTDINAFCSGDGSVRVFSSLMDLMNDDELVAVIGHEIGHMANGDVKRAYKNAYLTAAAKSATSAVGGTVGQLSDSQLGDLAEALSNAQFSQKQEYAADDYGFNFCVQHGYDPYGMANSLNKLDELSKGAKASMTEKMFSSHPSSDKRTAKMKEKADKYTKKK